MFFRQNQTHKFYKKSLSAILPLYQRRQMLIAQSMVHYLFISLDFINPTIFAIFNLQLFRLLSEMKRHQSQLLQIYSDTNKLVLYKRKLAKILQLTNTVTSPLQSQQSYSSTKIYLCLRKFMNELEKSLSQFGGGQNFVHHLPYLSTITRQLSNNQQLLTKGQALKVEINKIKQEWQQLKDPTIYYEQNQRQIVKTKLELKLQQLRTWQEQNRLIKKPLLVRKLQNELRNNLEKIADEELNFNRYHISLVQNCKRRLSKVSVKLINALDRNTKDSFVNELKNNFLRNYIDLFNDTSTINLQDLQLYRKDFQKTIQSIDETFKIQLNCLNLLFNYIQQLSKLISDSNKKLQLSQNKLAEETKGIAEELFSIVHFHDMLPVIYSSKHFYDFQRNLSLLQTELKNHSSIIEQTLDIAAEIGRKSGMRDSKRKNSPIEQFIQDKKVLEGFVKKWLLFEECLFKSFRKFMESYLKITDQIPKLQTTIFEGGKNRLENAFRKLFVSYLQESELSSTKNDKSLNLALRQSSKGFLAQTQRFLQKLFVFEQQIDMKDSYACSLGPKLLIHGRLKILPEGVYYQSSFNQKNYFFGKTKIFLPKQQIYEINKQSVLLFFADVLQVITKLGGIYFHALGKRQVMYEHFMSSFFPEIIKQKGGEEQIQFHEFKGDINAISERMKPFMIAYEVPIAKGRVQNISMPIFFHKYYSTTEFFFQGKTYKDFKNYLCELAEGRNIKCSQFTPGIPYYFSPKQKQVTNFDDLQESQRLFTYARDIPSIPFVGQGGEGICNQTLIYHWGGPKFFIIDLNATISGFSLTEGMTVKSRQQFQEVNGGIDLQTTAQVTFLTASPLNGMIRGPALSNFKQFMVKNYERLAKLQKNRASIKSSGNIAINYKQQYQRQTDKIQELQTQIISLKKQIKTLLIIFLVIFTLIIVLFYFIS